MCQPYAIGKKVSEWFFIQKKKGKKDEFRREKTQVELIMKKFHERIFTENSYLCGFLFNKHGYNQPQTIKISSLQVKKERNK